MEVSDTSCNPSMKRRIFPAKWYGVVSAECRIIGVNCPLDLFSFTPEVKKTAPQTEMQEVG